MKIKYKYIPAKERHTMGLTKNKAKTVKNTKAKRRKNQPTLLCSNH